MRLVIVSNRLPFTATEEKGHLQFRESAGGLVSGLATYLDSLRGSPTMKMEHVWVGWAGITVQNKLQRELRARARREFSADPVYLDEAMMDRFYHGFCNKTLWPLFHYFPANATFDEAEWQCYQNVNQVFCDHLGKILKPDDLLWIHDYHLMLLPLLIRQHIPNLAIGFFLHIPFPSFEIIRHLPSDWRNALLNGLLGADLVGFHLPDYTWHFLTSVREFLGYKEKENRVRVGERRCQVGAFPMGIDYEKFNRTAASDKINQACNELRQAFRNCQVILSVDRLDYAKGVLQRLRGFETFLANNPEWHGKVVLSLIVVPSRIGVQQYQETKREIDERVGEINGRFGGMTWTPILYQYNFLPFHQLVTLYRLSDIALVTPLRDGMNLVAKEFVATRVDQTGVLILSELAGVAKELHQALIINPNNVEAIAGALKCAVEMPLREQRRRIRAMQKRLARYTVVHWAEDFLQTLRATQQMRPPTA